MYFILGQHFPERVPCNSSFICSSKNKSGKKTTYWMGKKYLQMIWPIRDWYPTYISSSYNSTARKHITQLKSEWKNWIDIFQTGNADGPQASEKMINMANHKGNASKPQWDVPSHVSEWLSSERTQIKNVGEHVKKREPVCTVCENIKWYSHCGKQYGGFLKNLKENYHSTQQFHPWVYMWKKQKQ